MRLEIQAKCHCIRNDRKLTNKQTTESIQQELNNESG